MSKQTKQSKATAPAQFTLQGVPAQLEALETGLGLSGAVFSRTERKKTRSGSDHVPDGLIELVATHAAANGGAVAGVSYDAAAARDALTQVSTAQAAVRAARQFAQRVEDDATQRRATVADRTFGIYSALRRLVRTPEGAILKDTYDEMHSTVRAHSKARKARAEAAAQAKKVRAAERSAAKAARAEIAAAKAGATATSATANAVAATAPATAPVVADHSATPAPAQAPTAGAGTSPAQHTTSAN